MSIVNLNKRMTQDETEYSAAIRSSDSMIYVTVDKECENVPIITDPSGPDCLALHVGTCLYYKGCNWKIDSEKGVKIKAGTSVFLKPPNLSDFLQMFMVCFTGMGRISIEELLFPAARLIHCLQGSCELAYIMVERRKLF